MNKYWCLWGKENVHTNYQPCPACTAFLNDHLTKMWWIWKTLYIFMSNLLLVKIKFTVGSHYTTLGIKLDMSLFLGRKYNAVVSFFTFSWISFLTSSGIHSAVWTWNRISVLVLTVHWQNTREIKSFLLYSSLLTVIILCKVTHKTLMIQPLFTCCPPGPLLRL